MKKTVVVGMSGGVDSSVAAWLLKKQGYNVIGVTMQIWQGSGEAGGMRDADGGTGSIQDTNECSGIWDGAGGVSDRAGESGCCGLKAVEDARRVAEMLEIPYYVMNFRQEFKRHVTDYFVEEYLRGHTPNPCIACNRYVKWEALLHRSLALGADYIATGHYARVVKLPNGRYAVSRSVTARKDQTYALYNLTQEQLSHTLMPVGDYTKDQIRSFAEEIGLPVADKPDSQEICFVPDDDYAGFIDREAGGRVPKPGNFVDAQGHVLGRHKGITHYTVGQRRGVELPMGERVYVTDIRSDTDEVVIGKNEELFTREVLCDRVNFMAVEDITEPMRVFAKIRYNHKGEYCTVKKAAPDRLLAVFENPVRAAAPGQSICFYDGDAVLGGGIIVRPVRQMF